MKSLREQRPPALGPTLPGHRTKLQNPSQATSHCCFTRFAVFSDSSTRIAPVLRVSWRLVTFVTALPVSDLHIPACLQWAQGPGQMADSRPTEMEVLGQWGNFHPVTRLWECLGPVM